MSQAFPPSRTTDLLEVLDRVLDRGIVIDAEMTLTVAGLRVAGLEARIVVAAVETYLEHADAVARTLPMSWRWVDDGELPGASRPPEGQSPPRHRFKGFLDLGGDDPPFFPEGD